MALYRTVYESDQLGDRVRVDMLFGSLFVVIPDEQREGWDGFMIEHRASKMDELDDALQWMHTAEEIFTLPETS